MYRKNLEGGILSSNEVMNNTITDNNNNQPQECDCKCSDTLIYQQDLSYIPIIKEESSYNKYGGNIFMIIFNVLLIIIFIYFLYCLISYKPTEQPISSSKV
jgi:hypothetical protein